jgi:hypothetical protein
VSIATCAVGDQLLGGGASISETGDALATMLFSMPNPNTAGTPTGWQAQAGAITGSVGNTFTITAYAICGTA